MTLRRLPYAQTLFAVFCVLGLAARPLAGLEVVVDGALPDGLRDEIRAASLLVGQTQAETGPPRGQDIVGAAQADYARIVSVLYSEGYYAGQIRISLDGREAAGIAPISAPASVARARIEVTPGPRFRFGRAHIGPLAPRTTLPEGFRRGEVARLGTMRDAGSAAVEGWRSAGHAKARLAGQSITANHPNRVLNADLAISPGPRLRFGALNVTGNDRVRTERILEIAGLPTGKVFSPDDLERATRRLQRTGAFRSVALSEADRIGPGDSLGITAQLIEEKPRRFGFGAEISSQEGLGVSAFWLHRNLLGGAERFRVDGEVRGIGGESGGEDYRLSARFERPATFRVDTDLFLLAEFEELNEPSFFSRKLSLGAGLRYRASERREYRYGIGLAQAETRDAFGEQDYTLFLANFGLTREYRDSPLDATEGHYLNVEATPFVALEGADNGALTRIDYRTYHSFGETRPVTWAFRAQLGSVAGPSLAETPADFLFYSGGGGTVRGHGYQSLGVDLPSGETVGGRSFLGLSGEARVKTGDRFGLVGFYDLGFVGEDALPDGEKGEWHSGAGLGVRYDTGIGPLRFDVAVPMSGPQDGSDVQIYIGIGQAF